MIRRAILALLVVSAAPARADDVAALERGTAAFRAGDFAGAIVPLSAAHASDPGDSDTALLLGIAYYRLGRSGEARPLLEQAEAHGDAEAQASARVFLGLIADDRGESERAHRYFSLVASSPTELRASGRLLLDRSGAERWSVVAILRPGYDSNVGLMPATAIAAGGGGDADMTLIAAATARPALEVPLVLDETIAYRKQTQLTSYDMLSDALGGTLTFADDHDRATLDYHFEAALLGGARYEIGHVGDGAYRHELGDGIAAGAQGTVAARDYAQASYAGYSGVQYTGIAELAWRGIALGYVIDRDSTSDGSLAATSQGARATARLKPQARIDLRANITALARSFDEMGRTDRQLRADGAMFLEISTALGAVVGATVVRNASNAADFDYTKWTVFAGLVIGASS